MFSFVLSQRFLQTQSVTIQAEWNINDVHVRKKARNYREYLAETSRKISYSSIVQTIYQSYIQHDIKQTMKNQDDYKKIEKLILEALTNNDIEKLIRAYTLNSSFYRILNRHLAIIICADDIEKVQMRKRINMHYWQGPLDIATIFVTHPHLNNFHFKQGKTYRGLCVDNEEELESYRNIGTRFLNKTFVSTSKNRAVAEMFCCVSTNNSLSRKGCLFIYTLIESTRRTALDIHNLSEFDEEEEVLILPYATFEVTNYRPSISHELPIEIELKECESE